MFRQRYSWKGNPGALSLSQDDRGGGSRDHDGSSTWNQTVIKVVRFYDYWKDRDERTDFEPEKETHRREGGKEHPKETGGKWLTLKELRPLYSFSSYTTPTVTIQRTPTHYHLNNTESLKMLLVRSPCTEKEEAVWPLRRHATDGWEKPFKYMAIRQNLGWALLLNYIIKLPNLFRLQVEHIQWSGIYTWRKKKGMLLYLSNKKLWQGQKMQDWQISYGEPSGALRRIHQFSIRFLV